MPKKKKAKAKEVEASDEAVPVTLVAGMTLPQLPDNEKLELEPEVVVKEPSDYMKWLNSAPEARGNLTQRWYGETFIPEYKAWLEQGKQFDK